MSPDNGGKKDLRRLNHELSVLNEIARELNRSVNLGEALVSRWPRSRSSSASGRVGSGS